MRFPSHHFSHLFTVVLLMGVLPIFGCGQPTFIDSGASGSSTATTEGSTEPAVRIVFHADHFTDLDDFLSNRATQFSCLGDVTKVFKVNGQDYSGVPSAFASSGIADDFTVTTKPGFLKSVSVDVTRTYHPVTVVDTIQTDSCSYRRQGGSALPTSCADFDRTPAAAPAPTTAPTATPSPAPSPTATPSTTQYYETQFYRVRDDWCTEQGPILSSDIETTKALVGGVNIDIDRDELGDSEDLLMVVTYHALSSNYAAATNWPGVQGNQDQTQIKIHLVQTGLAISNLLGIKQPRVWSSYASTSYPVLWTEVATLEDPYGGLRSEQVILPISKDPNIDRIRIDRVRGSFHLFQVDLYRLGNRL
jgi:hypothetical protein